MKFLIKRLFLLSFLFCSLFCFAKDSETELAKPGWKKAFFFGCPWSVTCFGSEEINPKLFTNAEVGLGYCLSGGFIDTNHAGEASWWTRYYQEKIYQNLMGNKNEFELETLTSSMFHVQIDCSEKLTSEQEKELSISLAAYLAYNWAVYHEILTYYGFSITGIFSEAGSAFSPEDLYSDLLGTIVASEAIRAGKDFDTAYENSIKSWLNILGIQDKKTVKKAWGLVEKEWYNGYTYPFNKLLTRNWDIGQTGFLTPMLVSTIDENAKPIALPVPKIPCPGSLSIKVNLEPKESQKTQLLKITGKKEFFEPVIDFKLIVGGIQKTEGEKNKLILAKSVKGK